MMWRKVAAWAAVCEILAAFGLLCAGGYNFQQPHYSTACVNWGFEVPGGFVTTELRGGVSLVVSLLRNITPSARGAEQDIVVKDSTKQRELYREGPYSNIGRLLFSDLTCPRLVEHDYPPPTQPMRRVPA